MSSKYLDNAAPAIVLNDHAIQVVVFDKFVRTLPEFCFVSFVVFGQFKLSVTLFRINNLSKFTLVRSERLPKESPLYLLALEGLHVSSSSINFRRSP